MNRKCSTRKLFLKISQYSQENTFLIKMQAFRPSALLKKKLEHRCFFANIEKLLRTPILKNICERLLLRVSLKRFPIWTNNIRSEEDVFSKIKQNKNRSKTQQYEKTLAFSWCSLSFRFSLFLHFMADGICPTSKHYIYFHLLHHTKIKSYCMWGIN